MGKYALHAAKGRILRDNVHEDSPLEKKIGSARKRDGGIHSRRYQNRIEKERNDRVEQRDLAHGGRRHAHIRRLRRHADHDGEIKKIISARLLRRRKIHAAARLLFPIHRSWPPVEMGVVQGGHGMDRHPPKDHRSESDEQRPDGFAFVIQRLEQRDNRNSNGQQRDGDDGNRWQIVAIGVGLQMLRREARQPKGNQGEIGQEKQHRRKLDCLGRSESQRAAEANDASKESDDEGLMAAIAVAFRTGRGHGRHLSVGTLTF
ncbi:hypothetical protein AT6N2_C0812 [Agrobacterium tumefaciens]|nr:hypothetical protein AT6N2_C0812 [Agrobacterium tumefaciens]